MPVIVGTSGWQYADWGERFYVGVAKKRWFEHAITQFRTVELNVSFYRLPKYDVFAGWRRRSPDDAVIAVKASRYLTHVKRLRDPASSVELLMSRAAGLGPKLGPVLVQLPPDLQADPRALEMTLVAFPIGTRVAVEPRHASWWSDDVRDVLVRHGAALVWADRKSRLISPSWVTAPWGYVRMHEGAGRQWPFYGRRALAMMAERISSSYPADADVFVYFNNDPNGAAVDNAIEFAHEVGRRGRPVTRVPVLTP